MSGPTPNGSFIAWLAQATGIVGLLGAAYTLGKKFFSFVTRNELARITAAQDRRFLEAQSRLQAEMDRTFKEHREERQRIAEEQKAETLRLHEQNSGTFEQLFVRTAGIEQGQARIEGLIEGLRDRRDL